MVNNQKELTLQNLYDVVIRMDNKLDSSVEMLNSKIDSSFGILNNRIQDLDIEIDNSIKESEERVKVYVDNRFDKVDSRFDKIEMRLDKIELSTPQELEKRIMVVEEDSDLHDTYFRGIRTTLQVV